MVKYPYIMPLKAGGGDDVPDASSTVKGVVKLGSDTVQNIAAQTPSSAVGRTYPVQMNAAGQMVVNIPWVDGTASFAEEEWTFQMADGTTVTKTVLVKQVNS